MYVRMTRCLFESGISDSESCVVAMCCAGCRLAHTPTVTFAVTLARALKNDTYLVVCTALPVLSGVLLSNGAAAFIGQLHRYARTHVPPHRLLLVSRSSDLQCLSNTDGYSKCARASNALEFSRELLERVVL